MVLELLAGRPAAVVAYHREAFVLLASFGLFSPGDPGDGTTYIPGAPGFVYTYAENSQISCMTYVLTGEHHDFPPLLRVYMV